MKAQLAKEELTKAKEMKRWIYRLPSPPNRVKTRALRRGKVTIVFSAVREALAVLP